MISEILQKIEGLKVSFKNNTIYINKVNDSIKELKKMIDDAKRLKLPKIVNSLTEISKNENVIIQHIQTSNERIKQEIQTLQAQIQVYC